MLTESDVLAAYVAELNSVVAAANGDIAKYGEWQCDYKAEIFRVQEKIDRLIEAHWPKPENPNAE